MSLTIDRMSASMFDDKQKNCIAGKKLRILIVCSYRDSGCLEVHQLFQTSYERFSQHLALSLLSLTFSDLNQI